MKVIPVRVQTLIVSSAPSPSVLVLRPDEEAVDGKTRIVPIWVGSVEASHLGMALENARCARPMTHDLFLDALTNLDARVDHVVIDGMKGPAFFSKLVLRQAGRLIQLDARPSDAISLAVRQGAPLFIEEGTLEKGSFPFVFKEKTGSGAESESEAELDEFRQFLNDITPDDFDR